MVVARTTEVEPRRRESGYTLVALVVFLVVLNVAVAVALPMWSSAMQREREAELVFRGLQYAEAIRVFQVRFGRPPNRLEELLELEPRSIRQLWQDPLSESGEWETLLAGAGSSGTDLTSPQGAGSSEEDELDQALQSVDEGARGTRRRTASGRSSSRRPTPDGPAAERSGQIGPIEGVRPTARGEALRSFLGQTSYEKWEFRSQMLAAPNVTPEGVPLAPRIDPDALGRPFPPWLRSVPGSPPHPGVGSVGGDDGFGSTEDEDG